MEKETIFKEGDKVFQSEFGWGEIIKIDKKDRYCLLCLFGNFRLYFDENGYFNAHKIPHQRLSFTEYTVEVQGFSLKRLVDITK